jgi:glycine cleavage system H protein
MSNVPSELKYTRSHEWVRLEEDGTVSVGITDHAQELLGDLVFVEAPELDTSANTGDEIAVVESVKAASDIYCPISGEITGVNESLEDTPEIINDDPYEAGWIFKLKPKDVAELDDLMDAEQYASFAEEDH